MTILALSPFRCYKSRSDHDKANAVKYTYASDMSVDSGGQSNDPHQWLDFQLFNSNRIL